MPPIKHALLGASSAHRWLACTPSARLEAEQPDSSSVAAAEGTLAHELAEIRLTQRLRGEKPTTPERIRKHPLYHPVMDEYVDMYADYLMEHLTEARQTTPDAQLLLEQRVDFSEYVPEGFGTCDAVLISDGVMHVFDLKYGKGVPVYACQNPQIRLYGLGALAAYDMIYRIDEVVMHIVQPRLDSITSEGLATGKLRSWGDSIRPKAKDAFDGNGEKVAGEHCTFCRFKFKCRTYAMHQLEIAQKRFAEPEHREKEPDELTPAEISGILSMVDELTRWARGVKEYALEQAMRGTHYPGWKVVQGRSVRTITDESAAIDLLDQAGFTADRVTTLKGLTALEELVGKKALAELLGDLIVKPVGRPTLAKDEDRRPAIETAAQSVFKPLDDDE